MESFSNKQDGESQWLPISDLMSVLMMIFLLIAVSYMLKVTLEKEKIEEVAITYNKLQNELYEDLSFEFKDSLEDWGAEIDQATLSVRFQSPDILFPYGESDVTPRFKTILAYFFPRFIEILRREEYINEIEEIRIEGHTSQEGPDLQSYMANMKLSQDRTRHVLNYLLRDVKMKSKGMVGKDRSENINDKNQTLLFSQKKYRSLWRLSKREGHEFELEDFYRLNPGTEVKGVHDGETYIIPEKNYSEKFKAQDEFITWIRAKVTANGLSSSKLIINEDGSQNGKLSRRVEFRVRTNAEARIAKILGE